MAARDDDLVKFPRTQHLFDAGGHGVSRDDLVLDARDAGLFYSRAGAAQPVRSLIFWNLLWQNGFFYIYSKIGCRRT